MTVVESGAHSASLEMLLAGRVDGSAIDSTVLEWFMAERAQLATEIRVIDSFGPSPIPPWVISRQYTRSVSAHAYRARIDRFVAAEDRDYDLVRAIAKEAEQVSLL